MSNRPDALRLLASLAELPVDARDAAFDAYAGLADDGRFSKHATPPGPSLIGYHASALSAVVRTLWEVPLSDGDLFVDLGAGLGKAVLLARLLTPAKAHGIELQAPLVARARELAEALGADATFEEADVRTADAATLARGTVFYLYAPFTGDVLDAVLMRLRAVAQDHDIVVAALGVDLERRAPWLAPRELDPESFWLTLYDTAFAGARPRPGAISGLRLRGSDAFAVAFAAPRGRDRL